MTLYIALYNFFAVKSAMLTVLRAGMVQTRSQFEFCLMAVAEETHAILKALPQ